MTLWLLTALITGFAGSLHCVGMCGPLAMALPVGRLPLAQRKLGVGLYHGARLLAYAGLGGVVGSLGQGFLLVGMQRPLAIGAGLFLLIWLLLRRYAAKLPTVLPGRWISRSMGRFLREPSLRAFTGLGFLNGLLPCGSVYLALIGALTTPSPVAGAVYLLVFGLGTLPAMLSVPLLVSRLPVRWRQRMAGNLPLITLFLALLLLVRGVGLPSAGSRQSDPDDIPVCHGTAKNWSGRLPAR
jgi:sulfite exporter TauE/SafE